MYSLTCSNSLWEYMCELHIIRMQRAFASILDDYHTNKHSQCLYFDLSAAHFTSIFQGCESHHRAHITFIFLYNKPYKLLRKWMSVFMLLHSNRSVQMLLFINFTSQCTFALVSPFSRCKRSYIYSTLRSRKSEREREPYTKYLSLYHLPLAT